MMYPWRQPVLMLGAALMLISATIVAFGVIPPARSDTFPGAAPDRAVPAFWANVLLVLLLVAVVIFSSRLRSNRATLRRVLAGVSGFLTLVLGLLLIDAATAFSGHGPGMRGATVALWVCVCLDIAAGIGIIGSVFARQGHHATDHR